MKILVAPDKFKGCLRSFEVCEAVEAGIKMVDPAIDVLCFPMSDGGDGFASVMEHYLHTEKINCVATDPLGRQIETSYQWNNKTRVAIIEMAAASGLVLLKDGERDPLKTSTYGTGLLIKNAIHQKAIKIILGVGGSATNDGGTGLLAALGFVFLDKHGNALYPNGENLLLIEHIVIPALLPGIKFEIACDVQNVLYGDNGAAYVYAPQKGAGPDQVILLNNGLQHFAALLLSLTGKDISGVPGIGAAGGVAAGLMCFFDTVLKNGTDMVLLAADIEHVLTDVQLLITGEGKIDVQTSEGKVVSMVARMAKEKNIPVAAVCGITDLGADELKNLCIDESIVIADITRDIGYNMKHAGELLKDKIAVFISSWLGKKYNKPFDIKG